MILRRRFDWLGASCHFLQYEALFVEALMSTSFHLEKFIKAHNELGPDKCKFPQLSLSKEYVFD